MAIKVLVIPADVSQPMRVDESSGKLDDYQGRVGGLIEAVTLDRLWECDLWFNEEGKYLYLPINLRATHLFHIGLASSFDVIVGDAFITGPVDEEGDNTDVHPFLLGMLKML